MLHLPNTRKLLRRVACVPPSLGSGEGSLPACEARQQGGVLDWVSWALPSACASQLSQRFDDSEVCFHGQGKGKFLHYFLFVNHGLSPGAQMLLQLLIRMEQRLIWSKTSHFY